MTATVRTEPMPFVVRAARFVMTLQVAFGMVGLAFLGAAALSILALGPLLLVAWEAAILGLTGWLMSRFGTRATWVHRAVVGVEALVVAEYAVLRLTDSGGLDPVRLLVANALGPLPVIVLLLLPPSWRWFSQRKRTDAAS
ncbi:hypothetical protein ABT158_45655 [Nonomuraea sp. NPDC001636]|uniref:hypothetical protein n=1 Tax=Nonomuraea sp. NPDC001636 TaxID=3154391 RepID=UPI00332723AD